MSQNRKKISLSQKIDDSEVSFVESKKASKTIIQSLLRAGRNLSKIHDRLISQRPHEVSKIIRSHKAVNEEEIEILKVKIVPKAMINEGTQMDFNFTRDDESKSEIDKADTNVKEILKESSPIEFENPILKKWSDQTFYRNPQEQESNELFEKIGNWDENYIIYPKSRLYKDISANLGRPSLLKLHRQNKERLYNFRHKAHRRASSVNSGQNFPEVKNKERFSTKDKNTKLREDRSIWQYKPVDAGIFDYEKLLNKNRRSSTPFISSRM
ncbi:unnamed protein product [Blepharisma stoltei]|uniref:Uncharacterized protein n=1 Tax=Blepharisma stoltei TaxID=1481888 RepID=A0AAU9JST4_9CILI|nr:unnamed protein product [Blepharisma stoltei]